MAKEMSLRGKRFIGIAMLLLTTIVWGTAFSILKMVLNDLPVFFVLAIRFFPSGVLLGIFCIRRFKGLTPSTALHGAVLGGVLFIAYATQTLGLDHTTPARNAFITVSYCVMTPLLVWVMYKKRPHFYDLLSAVVCLVGLAFISLIGQGDDGGVYLLGDGLTLVAALFFAFQLVFIERFIEQGDDPFLLLVFELTVGGALGGLVSLCYELPTLGAAAFVVPAADWWRIVYLMLASSLLAQTFQMLGQRFTTSSQASIILSFESVFAAIFSVALGMERLTVYLVVGFVLVFAAGVISELHLDPMTAIRKRLRRTQVVPREEESGEEEQDASDVPHGDDA